MTKEKNKGKDMVKYRNEFNLTSLNALDKVEQDILFTICSRFTALKKGEVLMTFDELREKAYLSEKRYDYGKNIEKLRSLGEKVTSIKFTITDGDDVKVMALFPTLSIDLALKKVYIRLNPDFMTYLFDIPEKIGFSLYELREFIFLKSKYSKTLFRHLLQNFTGKWTVSMTELQEILGFPPSYTAGKVLQRIKEILPELEETGYFSDVELDYTTKNLQGRPIKDVIFTYKVSDKKRLESGGQTTIMDYDFATEEKAVKTVDASDPLRPVVVEQKVQTVKRCPRCGGSVITRVAKSGKRYEKCEKNDGSLLASERDCTYFQWLDEQLQKG